MNSHDFKVGFPGELFIMVAATGRFHRSRLVLKNSRRLFLQSLYFWTGFRRVPPTPQRPFLILPEFKEILTTKPSTVTFSCYLSS